MIEYKMAEKKRLKEEKKRKKREEKNKISPDNDQISQEQPFDYKNEGNIEQNIDGSSSVDSQNFNNDNSDNNKKKLTPEEQKYRRSQRTKLIIRVVLIVLNILLIGYLLAEIVIMVKDIVYNDKKDESSYITLCGKSTKVTNRYYGESSNGETVELNDYAVVGTKLFLSKYRIDSSYNTGFTKFRLKNVCADSNNDIITSGNYINLEELDKGDYLVYPNDEGYGKIKKSKPVLDTVYSLKDSNGNIKKISIKNNTKTPAMVISVSYVTSLPADYYDLVVYNGTDPKIIKELDDKKVKVCRDYQCVYNTRATFAVTVGEEYLSPSYLNTIAGYVKSETAKIGDYLLEKNDFIREASGHITSAGLCISDETCVVTPYLTDSHIGKISFVTKKYDNKKPDELNEYYKLMFSAK